LIVQSPTTVSDLTERELIARVQARLPPAPAWLVVGIGDDAAVVEPERNRLEVLTVDSFVEGVHFDRAFTPPDAIGHRALAGNLSDLAAMGADARLALLSLALPPSFPAADFDSLVDGVAALAARHRLHVIGGNLTRSPGPLVVDVTVAGTVKRRRALLRSGARPGDELWVSGTIGAAAAGLQMLKAGKGHTTEDTETDRGHGTPEGLCPPLPSVSAVGASCVCQYLYPEPRVRLGSILGRSRAASACMDLSDGLADAVRQVAEASGVGAVIDAAAVPLAADARQWFDTHGGDSVREAITGGDDYELLIACRPASRRRFAAAAKESRVPLTRIGVCTAGRAVVLKRSGGEEPMPRGYAHFQ
jgi:thiamine-monophosphate kinase